ncbi:hypothetical protein NVIE_029860 [Nitrososphaera viennensis EN76]|uniref:Uncharacterized protein n=1 Tax=Nitrososphaera viennensis EN76 TaxID=926571 RepID=A0A060HP44_9ARCH|nr:hypothetical protein NVIE_029860 [Nitrososphaera viennensis EN76]
MREALYERLRSLGANVNALKKFNLTDDELADFVNRLTKLMKKRGGTFLILGLILCTSLRG